MPSTIERRAAAGSAAATPASGMFARCTTASGAAARTSRASDAGSSGPPPRSSAPDSSASAAPRPRPHGLGLAAGQVRPVVVEHDDVVAAVEQLAREMRSDEAPPPISSTRPTVRHPDIIAAVSATSGRRQRVRQVRLGQPGRAAAHGLVPRARSTRSSPTAAPASLLDVGCGEGDRHAPDGRATRRGRVDRARRRVAAPAGGLGSAPASASTTSSATRRRCRSPTTSSTSSSLVEMLQLVEDPGRALAEAARVARSAVHRDRAARAAVARAERRARRLRAGARRHAGPPAPLVAPRDRRPRVRPRARSSPCAAPCHGRSILARPG